MTDTTTICCREALGRMLLEYAPMVRAICVRNLGRHHCDDVQQEAFLRVLQSYRRVRDARQLPGYLRRVATNLCFDRIRAHRSRPRVAQADDELLATVPQHEADRVSALELELREAIAGLPEALRGVLELFYFDRLDYRSIATHTGLTVAAVGQRLSRARRRLRQSMSARRWAG